MQSELDWFEINRSFGGTHCVYFQGRRWSRTRNKVRSTAYLAYSSTLKKEALFSSKWSLIVDLAYQEMSRFSQNRKLCLSTRSRHCRSTKLHPRPCLIFRNLIVFFFFCSEEFAESSSYRIAPSRLSKLLNRFAGTPHATTASFHIPSKSLFTIMQWSTPGRSSMSVSTFHREGGWGAMWWACARNTEPESLWNAGRHLHNDMADLPRRFHCVLSLQRLHILYIRCHTIYH